MDRTRMETEDISPRENEDSKLTSKLSQKSLLKIVEALKQAATMRGGVMEAESLRAYSKRLGQENLDDVLTALTKLGEMKRNEYEGVMPDVGGILAVVQAMAVARINRMAINARKTTMVRWECPDCGIHNSGFVAPDDHRERRCQGFSKDKDLSWDPRGGRKICGALLKEDFRQDDYKSGDQRRTA